MTTDARYTEYQVWIDAFVKKHDGRVDTLCEQATQKLSKAYPELTRVRGHVRMKNAPDRDERPWPHWWCTTDEGVIVDPTRAQFPCSQLAYVELDESKGEPTGKCPNCSELCYDGNYLCSPKCEAEYADYCNGGPL